MTTRLYFAGPYSQRLVLKQRAEELVRESGGAVEITSSWLDGEHEAQDAVATVEEMAQWARADIKDIDRSHLLIQFTECPSTRGGAHWECGYAVGMGMLVLICGPVTNVFHAAIGFRVPNWDEAKVWLLNYAAGRSAA
jgi:nucleoside 2-deoxyribosyltransferase